MSTKINATFAPPSRSARWPGRMRTKMKATATEVKAGQTVHPRPANSSETNAVMAPKPTLADTTKRGTQDRARINAHQEHELRDWAKSLGVDEHDLRNAVGVVSDNAERVREYPKNRSQRKGPHRAG